MDAKDYRDCDHRPNAFVPGAEKWGLTDQAWDLMDEALFIPMRGMVQSLNVSVATATLLFEALRQRQVVDRSTPGEGLKPALPAVAVRIYPRPLVPGGTALPSLGEEGELMEGCREP